MAQPGPIPVFVTGPSPMLTGGISSVIADQLSIDPGPPFQFEFIENTSTTATDEPMARRIARHVRHLRSLRRHFRLARGAIAHVHTCSGFSFWRSCADVVAAQRAGCRAILHVHGARFDQFHDARSGTGKRLIAHALRRADAVIVLSEYWQRQICRMSPRSRTVVIENAVPIPDGIPDRQGRLPVRFLMLARMDAWKGVDDLLEAAAHLSASGRRFLLTLAGPPGSTGDADTLSARIADRDLTGVVQYVGEVRGDAKRALLEDADVYVQPSRHEGMPISVLEAMSWGLPIVATRVGALPEVITAGEHGLLVPPAAPADLAAAMSQMIDDAALRHGAGAAARVLARSRFSLTRFAEDLRRCYRDTLAAGVASDVGADHDQVATRTQWRALTQLPPALESVGNRSTRVSPKSREAAPPEGLARIP